MSLYENNYYCIIFGWLESTCLSIQVIRKHKTIVQTVIICSAMKIKLRENITLQKFSTWKFPDLW